MKKKSIMTAVALLLAMLSPLAAQKSEMVLVEGGTFQMGSTDGEADAQDVHSITVSSFYMDRYKVTLSDWIDIIGERPCDYKNWLVWESPLPATQWNQMAAMGISWYEALVYCNRRSVLEGLTPCYSANGSKDAITYARTSNINSRGGKAYILTFSGVDCDWEANGYRLPTEAEWEYAARGGKNKSPYKYSGSDRFVEVINLANPYKIGQKKANALGIHDMSMGPEWCWDWYRSDYYKSSASIDPHGPDQGEWKNMFMSFFINGKNEKNAPCRVLRGGEYESLSDRQNETVASRSAVYARSYNNPENYDRFGALATLFMFRVVRNAKNENAQKNIIVRRNVEARVTGVPYHYFMTDDYDALCAELAKYNCRAPFSGELRPNPTLAQSVRDKMKELGACWSVIADNGSYLLNYYTPNEGPYIVYLKDLLRK